MADETKGEQTEIDIEGLIQFVPEKIRSSVVNQLMVKDHIVPEQYIDGAIEYVIDDGNAYALAGAALVAGNAADLLGEDSEAGARYQTRSKELFVQASLEFEALYSSEDRKDVTNLWTAANHSQRVGDDKRANGLRLRVVDELIRKKDFAEAAEYAEKIDLTEKARELYVLASKEAEREGRWISSVDYAEKSGDTERIKEANLSASRYYGTLAVSRDYSKRENFMNARKHAEAAGDTQGATYLGVLEDLF